MRTLKLTIAYDGSRYAGWQVQRRSHGPTVQGTLETAWRRILRAPVTVIGSGRTDAGVHAEGQVAHLRTPCPLRCERLLRSVNALLPPDVAILAVEEAPAGFHARYTARRKRYRYRIFTGPAVPPFVRPYVHHVRARLNVALMRREARGLVREDQFSAFARAGSIRSARLRRVTAIDVVRRGQELHIDVEGTGFLHTMVRTIAGTLIDVGRGRLPPGTVRRMLRTANRTLAGTTAPAQGLTLISVVY